MNHGSWVVLVILAARQPESGRQPRAVYKILWLRGIPDHTISGRGFNLFKLLRRHFRATMIPATIGSDVSSETVAREATTQFGKKFVELGSDPTLSVSELFAVVGPLSAPFRTPPDRNRRPSRRRALSAFSGSRPGLPCSSVRG